ncbi:MAG: M28 family metallopeptidase [Methanomassiliicoccales archaeon]|nr:M28 family metallopeptidase [Methanomassiliicoccales archaeon]
MSGHSRSLLAPLSIAAVLLCIFQAYAQQVSADTSSSESVVLGTIDGSSILDDMMALENIASSNFASRSAGSRGANESADWILERFGSMGLSARKEGFVFPAWDLRSEPKMVLDADGNFSSTGDQLEVKSFGCEQWSKPTPAGGVNGTICVLPLPEANYGDLGSTPINWTAWNGIDTTGKILVIGREVRWASDWESTFAYKIYAQRPAAIVYVWWYEWMAPLDVMFESSTGGAPIGLTPYLWNYGIPVGGVNYSEGRGLLASAGVAAQVRIDSVESVGEQFNVVASLPGAREPSKIVLVTAHYDSVLTNGFCDNAGGVAATLAIAKALSSAVSNHSYVPRFTTTFVAFTGEELGFVGSLNYVRMHQDQLGSIVAMLNLDCVGGENLVVSRTEPHDGLDLDEVLVEAASDLGIATAIDEPAGSDQVAFLDPFGASWTYTNTWGRDPEVGASNVPESSGLASGPIMYQGIWVGEPYGMIHTDGDSGDPSLGAGWMSLVHLTEQTRVGVLGVLRLTAAGSDGQVSGIDPTLLMAVLGVGVLAAVAVVGWRVRGRGRR